MDKIIKMVEYNKIYKTSIMQHDVNDYLIN